MPKSCHLVIMAMVAASGVVLAPAPLAAETAPDFRAEAEAFVAESLKDPNVYVMNPPVDADPYGDMSGKERFGRIKELRSKGGNILFLYPDGVPCELNPPMFFRPLPPPEDSKPPPPSTPRLHKQWYPDGRPQVVEEYLGQDLVSGLYYDAKGNLLGRVDQGKGTAFEMNIRPFGDFGQVTATCEYAGGKRNGSCIYWLDFDKKLKSRQETYRDGKKEGLALAWMQSGQLNTIAHYKNDRQDGDEVYFKPDGSVSSSRRYENSKIVAGATEQYDPKPYQQAPWERPPVRRTKLRTRDWPHAVEGADPSAVVTVARADKDTWGVRPKTGEVLLSEDRGQTWKVVKADIGFAPQKIAVTNYSEVFLWGVLPTNTPEKGLPNRILFSRDRGATWHTVSAPVDYLLGLEVQGDFLDVVGKFLPKAGLKAGEDWFGLYNWMIMTSLTPKGPGKRWTKMDMPFTGGEVKVVQTVERPGSEARLHVVRTPGWMDFPGGYEVHYHGSLSELPKFMARCEKQPDVAFGPDGKTVEVREPGKPAVVLDVQTGTP
ncbi:MAG: hypothetical protein WBC39_08770, partial [Phycisphaerae bacterium]